MKYGCTLPQIDGAIFSTRPPLMTLHGRCVILVLNELAHNNHYVYMIFHHYSKYDTIWILIKVTLTAYSFRIFLILYVAFSDEDMGYVDILWVLGAFFGHLQLIQNTCLSWGILIQLQHSLLPVYGQLCALFQLETSLHRWDGDSPCKQEYFFFLSRIRPKKQNILCM